MFGVLNKHLKKNTIEMKKSFGSAFEIIPFGEGEGEGGMISAEILCKSDDNYRRLKYLWPFPV